MFSAGIDMGSTTVKMALLENGKIVQTEITDALADPLAKAKSMIRSIPKCNIAATGYGRDLLEIDSEIPAITEIKAHAVGARFFFPEAMAIIDIGGQDIKIISLDVNGRIARFEMNDRCAAGTGNFIESMAKLFGLSLDDFVDSALSGKDGLTISAMCTVFAQSEAVGMLNRGIPLSDIALALHKSAIKRISSMFNRISPDKKTVVITGGGARNNALVNLLQTELQCSMNVPNDPQIIGALGCALYAASLVDPKLKPLGRN